MNKERWKDILHNPVVYSADIIVKKTNISTTIKSFEIIREVKTEKKISECWWENACLYHLIP